MSDRILFKIALATVLLVAAGASHAATGELWAVHSSMENKAFGRMDMGVKRECRPLNWRDNPEFKAPAGGGACKSNKAERRGNGYAWKFDCGRIRGEGSVKMIGRDRMEAQMQMDRPEGRFLLRMEARNLGSCNL